MQAGRIKSLIIVANDVYADVANDDFRVLKTQFPGTLLYWESYELRGGAMLTLPVAKFSDTPGPRSREEGDFSGEQFLEEVLLPQFEEAVRTNQKLVVDLDGAEGYATSFLEAAFGGLAP